MSSLGTYLRGLREAKGVALDDIARSTRVGRRHLEALESDNLGELPAPVFVKGFLRAYCEFLDVLPDEALALYREAAGEPAAERPSGPPPALRSRRTGPLVISLVLFVALGASLFALRLGLNKGSPRQVPAVSAPVKAETDATPGATKTGSAPATPASPAATEPKPAGQRLVVRAIEPTWIRVQMDEGQVAEELLQTGAVREWTAGRRFVLTIGNAGGIELDLNGQRIPPLGPRGAVIQKLVLPQDAPGTGS